MNCYKCGDPASRVIRGGVRGSQCDSCQFQEEDNALFAIGEFVYSERVNDIGWWFEVIGTSSEDTIKSYGVVKQNILTVRGVEGWWPSYMFELFTADKDLLINYAGLNIWERSTTWELLYLWIEALRNGEMVHHALYNTAMELHKL